MWQNLIHLSQLHDRDGTWKMLCTWKLLPRQEFGITEPNFVIDMEESFAALKEIEQGRQLERIASFDVMWHETPERRS